MDAALELFTDRSYAATTVPDIAQRAGVASGTIYRYFPSKEALANAIYQREKGTMRDALASALADLGPSPTSKSEAFACWSALVGLLDSHRRGVLFLEGQQHAAYLNSDSTAVAQEVDAIGFGVIARGQSAGAVKPGDPRVMVAMFFGAFVGLAKLAHVTSDAFDQTADAVWDLIAEKERS